MSLFVKIILSALVGVLAIGAGAGIAYLTDELTPEQRLLLAIEKHVELDTFEYDLLLDVVVEDGESGSKQNVKLSVAGASDVSEIDNLKSLAEIGVTIPPQPPFTLEPADVGFEVRALGGVVYFSLTKIPEAPDFGLGAYLNKWISVSPEDAVGYLEPGMEGDLLNSFTEDQLARTRQLIVTYPPVSVQEDLGREEVDGVDTYAYQLVINQENIAKLFPELMEIFLESFSVEQRALFDEDGLRGQLAEFRALPPEKLPKISVWIGADDFYVRKVLIVHSSEASRVESDGFSYFVPAIDAILTMNMRGFNEPVTITVPEGATPIMEVVASFFAGSMMLGGADDGVLIVE